MHFFSLNRVPIITKREMEKKENPRGKVDRLYQDDIELVCWKDNKPVYIASNKFDGTCENSCRRFNRVERKNMQIPIPYMIKRYNENMGRG